MLYALPAMELSKVQCLQNIAARLVTTHKIKGFYEPTREHGMLFKWKSFVTKNVFKRDINMHIVKCENWMMYCVEDPHALK